MARVFGEALRNTRLVILRIQENEMALTNWEVQDLVYAWFHKITYKAPVEELQAMLSTEGLEMKFPDSTMKNHADFSQWYHTVTHLFFDQVHEIKFLAVSLDNELATVNLIVNWQARTWQPPAAFSEWQGAYVHQTWTVKKDAQTEKPVIVTYLVGQFDPMKLTGLSAV
jgi:hypothetical protein